MVGFPSVKWRLWKLRLVDQAILIFLHLVMRLLSCKDLLFDNIKSLVTNGAYMRFTDMFMIKLVFFKVLVIGVMVVVVVLNCLDFYFEDYKCPVPGMTIFFTVSIYITVACERLYQIKGSLSSNNRNLDMLFWVLRILFKMLFGVFGYVIY